MSRNRLSLLRAMHKLAKDTPQQQPIPQETSKSQGILAKSYLLGALAVLCVGGTYWNYVSVKNTPIGEQERMALQENDKKCVEEGLVILKQRYSK